MLDAFALLICSAISTSVIGSLWRNNIRAKPCSQQHKNCGENSVAANLCIIDVRPAEEYAKGIFPALPTSTCLA